MQNRKSGILLHPTSLPFAPGIGTFGKSAFRFINWLEKSGIKLWQVLPLGPTGYGDSPYQSFSSFALNPLLVDLDDLVEDGFASVEDAKVPKYVKKTGSVDYGAVVHWKINALKRIADKFFEAITNPSSPAVPEYMRTSVMQKKFDFFQFYQENESWLKDYSAFMSIKDFYEAKAQKEREETKQPVNASWNVYWDKKLSKHDKKAVEFWVNSHQDCVIYQVIQFFASYQWLKLKEYANSKGVQIIGDMPIFVAPDSVDVWANQKFFQLDADGRFINVAGVPPDYFSAIGQLWGNPLYDWDAIKKDKYSWWIARMKQMLKLFDYVRIDHFRGFESYWSVPYGSENAVNGKWVKGPGKALFDALKKNFMQENPDFSEIPLIAEDLGIITDEVAALRDSCGFPGMKVLQFGFDKNEYWNKNMVNAFLPHNFSTTNCVAYTGTHDNDTTQGFLNSISEDFVSIIASYVEGRKVPVKEALKLCDSGKLTLALVRSALASIAMFAIIPFQDLYSIGSEARMNMPSTSGANWSWRADLKMFEGNKADEKAEWLRELNTLYAR
ncbi:MAG: 4-alpha-glucanotransferase [Treponema sp.]|nr:4-alpha-glucanotransferase [Treponema sp.]